MRFGTLKVVEPLPPPQGKSVAAVVVEAIAFVMRVRVVPLFETTVVPGIKHPADSTAPPIGVRSAFSTDTVMFGEPIVQVIVCVAVRAE